MTLRAALILALMASCSALFGQDYPMLLKEEPVPRAEIRQQILEGIKEYRYAWFFAKAPMSTHFFAECYTDGKFTHRYMLTMVMTWNQEKYAKGTLSLGWNFGTREMVLIDDNGFGLWNSRLVIPPDDFDRLSVEVAADNPISEVRDTPNAFPKKTTVHPILGLVGVEDVDPPPNLHGAPGFRFRGKTHFTLTSTADFVQQATRYGAKHCLVIYALSTDNGGNAPFPAENREQIQSLPMN